MRRKRLSECTFDFATKNECGWLITRIANVGAYVLFVGRDSIAKRLKATLHFYRGQKKRQHYNESLRSSSVHIEYKKRNEYGYALL
jgi:hypothetical protein